MPKKKVLLSILGKLVGTFFFPPAVKPHFEHENRDKKCIVCPYFHVQKAGKKFEFLEFYN